MQNMLLLWTQGSRKQRKINTGLTNAQRDQYTFNIDLLSMFPAHKGVHRLFFLNHRKKIDSSRYIFDYFKNIFVFTFKNIHEPVRIINIFYIYSFVWILIFSSSLYWFSSLISPLCLDVTFLSNSLYSEDKVSPVIGSEMHYERHSPT